MQVDDKLGRATSVSQRHCRLQDPRCSKHAWLCNKLDDLLLPVAKAALCPCRFMLLAWTHLRAHGLSDFRAKL